ncbi:CoA transferase [Microbacterium thalassium]|uniref:Crotonobetainyl-CoA:carnitine CoA-transferase CaiB-like acyl-CoA transferase n=1 Tax=Microbacterium thalassium TaxID=362649 RepID=A0A7X0FR52_9MICO|nr:CoA transferase [Microbacterium thalassium]MBB6391571.1 crotonobetainyl-CoA:carnitine CoA-transferase CaiB-like acyl-CoA transferase [Microbacterium thalassium]GLK24035.1 putative L-carnitine dehydratase [Microbacterium thalassium]
MDISGAAGLPARVRSELSLPHEVRVELAGPPPLASRLDVAGLAAASVGAAASAAAQLTGAPAVALYPDRIAVAYSSERWVRVDGAKPTAFAPLSGFFRTADGWVRTHGNYPHHADAMRRVLDLPADADRDSVAAALLHRDARAVSSEVSAAGGLCVSVDREDPRVDARLRTEPLLHVSALGAAPAAPLPDPDPTAPPLRGIRVLDLTRVIAGPVGTRTLALLGAEVLRLDPPRIPEIAWQHLDTGHGKRSALLDLATAAGRSRFDGLLETADVVALGYRPAALDRLGLSPADLAARRPGLIVARHSAWGDPERRGFDSLVQAASGIAWVESPDGERPGTLPAQALDHSAGYLLAAGVLALLERRAREGGSWLVETSLRRVAAELLGMPRTADPEPARSIADASAHLQTFDVGGIALQTAAPALTLTRDGEPPAFRAPRPWGQDEARWSGD